jgi:hypothetical protein
VHDRDETQKSWKQSLGEMQGKAAYIRLKVVGPFPDLCASGSYVHRVAFFLEMKLKKYIHIETFKNIYP